MAVLDILDILPHDPPAKQAVDINPEMLLQIATGLEEPVDIAQRYGFNADEFAALSNWPPWQAALEAKRTELQQTGVTLRIKSAFMAEDVLQRAYLAVCGHDATLPQKMDFIRLAAKLGDVEPKPSFESGQVGNGFSITINLPTTTKGETFEHRKTEGSKTTLPIEASGAFVVAGPAGQARETSG